MLQGRVIVTAVVGGLVLLAAAVGLALDVDRGAPTTTTFQPWTTTMAYQVSIETTPGSSGLGGQCVPACTPDTWTATILLHAAPPLLAGAQYVVTGSHQGVIEGEVPRLILDGEGPPPEFDIEIQWRDADGRLFPILVHQGGEAHLQLDVQPFTLSGQITTEQIGAVEISALFAAAVEAHIPAGTQMFLWDGDQLIGAFVDGTLDERIERFDLSGDHQFAVLLHAEGAADGPGIVLAVAL